MKHGASLVLHAVFTVVSAWKTMISSGPVLVIRCGAFGDMVQFSAVVAALADHHDQPVDLLSGGGFAAEALVGMPEVARRFAVHHRRRPIWLAPDLARLARTLAERRYAHVYVFDRSPVIEQALAASGATMYDAWLPTRQTHVLEGYAATLARFGVAVPQPFMPRVVATPAERQAARELVASHGLAQRPLLVVQAGNARTLHPFHRLRPTRDLKAWPTASWIGAIAGLAQQHPDAGIVLAGAPAEWSVAEDIRAGLPPDVAARCANLAQELPVRTLAGLLAEATGCLSVDTGPAHLAAALGCPLTVLFGPADPAEMAPRGPAPVAVVRSGVACSPCYGTARRRTCRENSCMRRITVTQVLMAWSTLRLSVRRVA
jgi:heptosyltransferase-2/heptosyltransferase-3